MPRDPARVDAVAAEIADRTSSLGNFNLIPVVMPIDDVQWVARELTARLSATAYDFDGHAIEAMEQRGWSQCRALERTGIRGPVLKVLEAVALGIADAQPMGRPVLVHNVNTPVAYGFSGVADYAYRCSSSRHVVLCLGGSWQAGRILLHDRMPLMGAALVQPVVVGE